MFLMDQEPEKQNRAYSPSMQRRLLADPARHGCRGCLRPPRGPPPPQTSFPLRPPPLPAGTAAAQSPPGPPPEPSAAQQLHTNSSSSLRYIAEINMLYTIPLSAPHTAAADHNPNLGSTLNSNLYNTDLCFLSRTSLFACFENGAEICEPAVDSIIPMHVV